MALMVVVYLAILLLGSGPMAAGRAAGRRPGRGGVPAGPPPAARLAAERAGRPRPSAQGYEVEMLTAMETLKATGCEQRAVAHWSNLFVDQLNVQLAARSADREDRRRAGVAAHRRPAGGAGHRRPCRCWPGGSAWAACWPWRRWPPASWSRCRSLVQTLLSLETVRGYLDRVDDVLAADARAAARGPAAGARRWPGGSTLERRLLPLRPAGAAGGGRRQPATSRRGSSWPSSGARARARPRWPT